MQPPAVAAHAATVEDPPALQPTRDAAMDEVECAADALAMRRVAPPRRAGDALGRAADWAGAAEGVDCYGLLVVTQGRGACARQGGSRRRYGTVGRTAAGGGRRRVDRVDRRLG